MTSASRRIELLWFLIAETEKKDAHTTGFKQLDDRPHCNMLERCIGAAEEAVQVLVHATLGRVPHIVEGRVIVRCRTAILARQVAERGGAVALHLRRGAVCERDEHLADAHLKKRAFQLIFTVVSIIICMS
jgi:hypothetical protein